MFLDESRYWCKDKPKIEDLEMTEEEAIKQYFENILALLSAPPNVINDEPELEEVEIMACSAAKCINLFF